MSYEECNCRCHSNAGILHCMPCCIECKSCGKNIILSEYKEHEKKCKEESNTKNFDNYLFYCI